MLRPGAPSSSIAAHRHADEAEIVVRAELELVEGQWPNDDLLDGVVGESLRTQGGQPLAGEIADPVLLERADGIGLDSEIGDRLQGALGHRVHHARLGQHVHKTPRPGRRRPLQGGISHSGDHGALDDRVGKQFAGNPVDLVDGEIALNEITSGGRHGEVFGQAEIGRIGGGLLGDQVGLAFGRVDVNFPKHRGSSWLE